ncbi:hypothetical protein IPA_03865 [Ignicoccus pacificus DSM 13166]|uniref:Uncharacterized protein n=1 Tax=Ignicoccus pacificus DSM 13166 TaxID=940294 RepID=A0A977KAZ9_9CREN|nr:hypothetical protein IPA_03865 [Ignicoccus pacificus DSM 13166]
MCTSPSECRKAALRAAEKGIEYLRKSFLKEELTNVVEDHKTDVSRKVDLEVEDIIIRTLREEGFKGSIVTEEKGVVGDGEDHAIIDPLDGSLDFSVGMPYFIVSVAIAKGETLRDVVAGALCPSFGHPCYSFDDRGVYEGDLPLKRGKREKVMIFYGDPESKQLEFLKRSHELLGRPKIRTPGAIAFDLLHLVRGKVLAVIDIRNKLRNVDIASAIPMYLRVGGNVNEDVLDTKVDSVRVAGDIIALDDEEKFKELIQARAALLGRR